jgi:adenylosuccinate synthase
LTHLDIYDSFEEIQVCVGYRVDGRVTELFPASRTAIANAEPVLKTLPGWKAPSTQARSFSELPSGAQDYVRYIEKYTGVPVEIISVGSDREHTIVERDPWTPS